jgi:hypothetical protein
MKLLEESLVIDFFSEEKPIRMARCGKRYYSL